MRTRETLVSKQCLANNGMPTGRFARLRCYSPRPLPEPPTSTSVRAARLPEPAASVIPRDLQTALDQPAAVHPGDTIWLRGGTYTGHFVASINGTSAAPILVKQYPGERAKLDGNYAGNLPTLEIHGVYTWYWGFEIYNSDPGRWSDVPGDPPARRGEGLQTIGDHLKLINMIIRDTSQGIMSSTSSNDIEIFGCLIYYNGYDATDRGHGHGIYSANDPGNATKKIHDNIIFEQFGYGLHAYTEGGDLDNIQYQGNTVYDNGGLSSHGWSTNILLGGLAAASTPHMYYNMTSIRIRRAQTTSATAPGAPTRRSPTTTSRVQRP